MRVRLLAAVPVAVLALSLAACVPEPTPSETGSATAAPSSSSSVSPSATSAPTSTPAALPASCEQLYSTDMLAMLQSDQPPLNDPGLTLLSTENVQGLDLLASGVPTLRCTWGAPGRSGVATTVARIDGDAGADVQQSLLENGFACEPLDGGSICRMSVETIDQQDVIRKSGEVHWFGDGFWSATRWVDDDPEGYTEDIAARLAS